MALWEFSYLENPPNFLNKMGKKVETTSTYADTFLVRFSSNWIFWGSYNKNARIEKVKLLCFLGVTK